jgi:hypothetical protein
MKNPTALLAGLILLTLVTGCPFTSKVPLGEPGHHPVDARLIGRWVSANGDGDTLRFTVLPFNDAEYYVEMSESKGESSRYRAFVFDFQGQPFLHINELSKEPASKEYCFARYTLSGDRGLSVRFVGEKIVPKAFATEPDSLAAFLAAHLNDPALDDSDANLVLEREESGSGTFKLKLGGGGTVKP